MTAPADATTPPTVRAARGSERTARGWPTEAALRMLCNNLDPEVAERPADLVVYGGTGKAARDWPSFHAMVATLRGLAADETMLVVSGRPVGVLRTSEWAPRVLIANSNLVPDWASWPEFRRLEALGLTMYGQMTAGSWIYIGTQGILQGTYETFAALAAQRYGGTLRGRLVLTAGLGGMGGAQPLAVTMNDGVALVVECDPARLRRRLDGRYLDRGADSLDEAVRICEAARAAGEPLSVGVIGNAAEVLPELLRRGVEVDVVTDQTSAHDPLSYLPRGVDVADWGDYAAAKPDEFTDRSRESMAEHVEAMVGFADRGAEVFDYGNSLRGRGQAGRLRARLRLPGVRARRTSGRCSARARARSAGRRCPGTRPTSRPPTPPCSTCSRTTTRWPGGSGWPGSGCSTRACRPGSAGWAWASGTGPGCGSTRWWPTAGCRRRS